MGRTNRTANSRWGETKRDIKKVKNMHVKEYTIHIQYTNIDTSKDDIIHSHVTIT